MKEEAIIRAAINVIEAHYIDKPVSINAGVNLDKIVLEHVYQILLTIDDPHFESEDK